MPKVEPDEYIQYRGRQLIDKGIIEEYEFEVPYAEDPSGVISYYTKRVCEVGGLAGRLRRVRGAGTARSKLSGVADLRGAGGA